MQKGRFCNETKAIVGEVIRQLASAAGTAFDMWFDIVLCHRIWHINARRVILGA